MAGRRREAPGFPPGERYADSTPPNRLDSHGVMHRAASMTVRTGRPRVTLTPWEFSRLRDHSRLPGLESPTSRGPLRGAICSKGECPIRRRQAHEASAHNDRGPVIRGGRFVVRLVAQLSRNGRSGSLWEFPRSLSAHSLPLVELPDSSTPPIQAVAATTSTFAASSPGLHRQTGHSCGSATNCRV